MKFAEIRDQGAKTCGRVFVGNGAVGNLRNRQDQITMSIAQNPDPEAATVTLGATVSGAGAFAGVTSPAGSGTGLTLTRTSTSPLIYGVRFLVTATAHVPVTLATTTISVFDDHTGAAIFT
jgi:hypothetical protein